MNVLVAASGDPCVPTVFPGVRPPPVAVVVGCHDQIAYVEAAIRSVAAQTYRNLDCVVVDDASTDESAARIADVLASLGDPRFRAILKRENGGQMSTILQGLDATTAPFVAFLDADDLWHPAFLERHVLAHLSGRGLAAVSTSNLALIDAQGVQLSGTKPPFLTTDLRDARSRYKVHEEATYDETRLFVARGLPAAWIWSATSALVFRRAAVAALRPARPERLRICADYYLARGAHMLGGTVRIERSLGAYRLHDGNRFARQGLLGDRVRLGTTPEAVMRAAGEAFVERLCAAPEMLREMLSPAYVADLLLHHLGREGAEALARSDAGARLILSAVPPPPPSPTLLDRIGHHLGRRRKSRPR